MAASCCVVCIWAASYCVGMPLNYAVQYNALQRRYSALVSLLRQVLRILAGVAAVPASAGALRRAVALLATEVGDETSDDETSDGSAAEAEEEAAEVAMEVDPTVAVLAGAISDVRNAPVAVQSAPGFLAFSGRIYRLA